MNRTTTMPEAGEATNRYCQSCTRTCKQNDRCVVVCCPFYVAGPRAQQRDRNR